MYLKSGLAAALALCLSIGPENAQAQSLEEALDGFEVIEEAQADVLDAGLEQQLLLIGRRSPWQTPHYREVQLVVAAAGEVEEQLTLDNMSGFYGARKALFLGDFTGDGIPDVFVALPTGGSGGLINYRLVSWASGQGAVLFGEAENRGLVIRLFSENDWRLRISTEQGSVSMLLAGTGRRTDYQRLGYYDAQGNVLKPLPAFAASFSWLEPEDRDGDGHYMLRGWQQLSGAYRADQLGWVESVWRYENGAWSVGNVSLGQRLMP